MFEGYNTILLTANWRIYNYKKIRKILINNRHQFLIAFHRFGIELCYYYHKNYVFPFASELKSIVCNHDIKKEVDSVSMCNYLTYYYVHSLQTIWKNSNVFSTADNLIIKEAQSLEINKCVIKLYFSKNGPIKKP